MSFSTLDANSIQPRWSARMSASAGCSGGAQGSSRYSRITADSKIVAAPSTRSSGVRPSGEIARNQAGLFARSTSRRRNAAPFSCSAIATRCTYGHSAWLTSSRSAIAVSSAQQAFGLQRIAHRGPRCHALLISRQHRPVVQVDAGAAAPVEDRVEICVGHAELLAQHIRLRVELLGDPADALAELGD